MLSRFRELEIGVVALPPRGPGAFQNQASLPEWKVLQFPSLKLCLTVKPSVLCGRPSRDMSDSPWVGVHISPPFPSRSCPVKPGGRSGRAQRRRRVKPGPSASGP